MTATPEQTPGTIGKRYWIIVVVAIILGLSLLFSFDFSLGQFGASTWSDLISGVQVSTLVVVIAFFLWWARGRSD